jgi:anti-anti-sigma factor
MKFTVEKSEKYTVLKLEEVKLNSLLAPELKSELLVLNTAGFRNVIIDLSSVAFVDSSGLSALLIGNRLCKESNGSFILTGIQDNVQKLLTISQLNTILITTPTLSEAIDYAMMEELAREINSVEE